MDCIKSLKFYNHLIPSGTKMAGVFIPLAVRFYNHLIPSGTKINEELFNKMKGFTIT